MIALKAYLWKTFNFDYIDYYANRSDSLFFLNSNTLKLFWFVLRTVTGNAFYNSNHRSLVLTFGTEGLLSNKLL